MRNSPPAPHSQLPLTPQASATTWKWYFAMPRSKYFYVRYFCSLEEMIHLAGFRILDVVVLGAGAQGPADAKRFAFQGLRFEFKLGMSVASRLDRSPSPPSTILRPYFPLHALPFIRWENAG